MWSFGGLFICNWAWGAIQRLLNGRAASLNIKSDKYILASSPWASKCQSINNQWTPRADGSEYECVLLAVPRWTWNGWKKEGREILSTTHTHKKFTLSMHGYLKHEHEMMKQKKKGLQKNQTLSIGKQDWDSESENTHGQFMFSIWTRQTR